MLRSNAVDILRLITTTHIQNQPWAKADKKLEVLFEETGSNQPVYTCSVTRKKYKSRNIYYLTIAKSTEELFH